MTSSLPPQHGTVGAVVLETSDEALVQRAQAGSMDSFAELLTRFEGRIFNFVQRRIGGRTCFADAQDLTQETFLRAWRSLGAFQPPHRFSTWLFTIAGRLVVDHLRHRAVRAAATAALAAEALTADDHDHAPTTKADWLGRGGENVWAIAQRLLTDEQHAALWLRYAEDLSPGEIARVLDKNEVAVRVMLFRARQTLAPLVRRDDENQDLSAAAADSRPARPAGQPRGWSPEISAPPHRTARVVMPGGVP